MPLIFAETTIPTTTTRTSPDRSLGPGHRGEYLAAVAESWLLKHLDVTPDSGRTGKSLVRCQEVGTEELCQSNVGGVVSGQITPESPNALQQRKVPVALNGSPHELSKRSVCMSRADQFFRQQSAQDVRELEIDQGGRGNRYFFGKPRAHWASWFLIDDSPDPDAGVCDGQLAPAARNQIPDLAIG